MSRKHDIKKADVYFRQGKFHRAVLYYSKAILQEPMINDAKLYNHRGLAYLKLNKCGIALDDFKQALELDPTLEAASHNLELATAKQRKKTFCELRNFLNKRMLSCTSGMKPHRIRRAWRFRMPLRAWSKT